jgi:hypothetical protein
MAITTLDQLAAGILPLETHLFRNGLAQTGSVDAAWLAHEYAPAPTTPTATIITAPAGVALTSWSHQIPMPPAVAGKKLYIAGLTAYGQMSAFAIIDRLWHAGTFTGNTASVQTVNSVAWPARDRNQSSDGEGVMIAITGTSGANGPVNNSSFSVSYTNSSGTAGRTGLAFNTAFTPSGQAWVKIALDAGDTGVRSVQSVTVGGSLGAYDFHLVAFRALCRITRTVPAVDQSGTIFADGIALGLPEVFDNSVLCWLNQNYANGTSSGSDVYVKWAQG